MIFTMYMDKEELCQVAGVTKIKYKNWKVCLCVHVQDCIFYL